MWLGGVIRIRQNLVVRIQRQCSSECWLSVIQQHRPVVLPPPLALDTVGRRIWSADGELAVSGEFVLAHVCALADGAWITQ